jgi:tetratricopeptide (TPR) repeat protein
MEKLYQTYKDDAAIYIVYISEAHASDDSWPVGYAKEMGIKEHTNYGERCAVAEKLVKDKKLTIPCLIDNMDNKAAEAYQGWPDRVFLVRTDGRLAVAAARGPWGFKPGLEAAEKWLAEYKKTGKQPTLSETKPEVKQEEKADFAELNGDLHAAYQDGKYKKALAIGLKMHEMRPKDSGTQYNIACLCCLLGKKDKAYSWLDKAIDAGWDEADQMRNDDDFKAIRGEDRFKALLKRAAGDKKDPEERAEGSKKKPKRDLPDEV